MGKKFDVIVGLWLSIVLLSVVLSILLPVVSIGLCEHADISRRVRGLLRDQLRARSRNYRSMRGEASSRQHSRRSLSRFSGRPSRRSWRPSSWRRSCPSAWCSTFCPRRPVPFFIFAWLKVYPYALLSIYISSMIFAPVGVAIAKKVCKVPPVPA